MTVLSRVQEDLCGAAAKIKDSGILQRRSPLPGGDEGNYTAEVAWKMGPGM